MSDLATRIARERCWAVVGASADPGKFGNRIFTTLKGAGYRAYAVNPSRPVIDGSPAFASLEELPETPAVALMVIPPRRTGAVVQKAAELGIPAVWFQPGSEDPEAISLARSLGLEVVEDCILVRHVQQPAEER